MFITHKSYCPSVVFGKYFKNGKHSSDISFTYGGRLRSDCRSKSEKAGFRSKIFDRDPIFLDFDPERIAIQRSQSIVMDLIQIFVLCVFLILELKTSNFKLLNLFCLRGTVWENGTIQYSLVDLKCFFFLKPISNYPNIWTSPLW